MKTYTELLPHIESRDYETHFWSTLRGRTSRREASTPTLDLSPYGIRVNCLAPGVILTDIRSPFYSAVLSGIDEKLSEYGMINADVDRDGSTNSLDALNILKYTIALIEEFPD